MQRSSRGFTLIELLVVTAIISMLASVVLVATRDAREKGYAARAKQEFNTMATALELYRSEHGDQYPPDVNRNIPPGLGPYLAGGDLVTWPSAPWPGSVYDWDYWPGPPDVYQISVRFCPQGGPISSCNFPKEAWAKNFVVDSAAYWCISGPCHSHVSVSVPGYCMNCTIQPDPVF